MLKRWIIPIFVGILYANSFAQTTFIRNGNFEEWNGTVPGHWVIETDGITLTKDTVDFYDGTTSARIQLTSKETQILSQDSIPVIGGNTYRLVMYVKDNDPAGRLRFWGYWRGHDVSGGPQSASYSSDEEDWQIYEMDVDVPLGAIWMDLGIRFYDVSSSWDGDAEFHIDAISLESISAIKPAIFNVTDSVFCAESIINVEATIRDDSEIGEAWLYYRLNGSSQPTEVSMSPLSTEQWSGQIPACQEKDQLEYWIKAVDNENEPNIAVTDTFRVLIGKSSIEAGNTSNEQGFQIFKGYKAKMCGVVTVASNMFSLKNQNSYIQDNTGGINVYSDDKRAADLALYDSVEIIGLLDQRNGRSIIIPERIEILSEQAQPPAVPSVTCIQVDESYEGQLVGIHNVSIEGWTDKADTSFDAMITDGTADLMLIIHEQTDIDGNDEPSDGGTTNIIGIVSQIDEDAPYLDGYCIMPRSMADFSVTAIEQISRPISSLELYQNYPNPFNPVTRISYRLDKTRDVKVTICNVLGQEIVTIKKKNQSAGVHYIEWNGESVPSGIYFCVMTAGENRHIRKMVLAK